MAVWNWYMTRAMRERVAIVVAIAAVVILVIGTISSLTDEDHDEEDVDDGMNPATSDLEPGMDPSRP